MTKSAVAKKASGAQLRLRQSHKNLRRGQGGRPNLARRSGRRLRVAAGPERLGQDDHAQPDRRLSHARCRRHLLDERSIADVPPHKRNIGMVFQSYSLFPHMTVAENVGFPLRMRTRALARGRRATDRRDARAGAACASRQPLSAPALRRAAAARGDGARAGLASAPAADGRAARRARQEAARADAGRDQAHPPQRRHHGHLRHARPGRGA